MNGTNSRRGFLKGFGLFSAVAAGATTSHFTNTGTGMDVRDPVNPVLVPTVDKALAPSNPYTLSIVADNVVMDQNPKETGMLAASQPTIRNEVTMSVGKDNRLWIRVGDQWRRVALEG